MFHRRFLALVLSVMMCVSVCTTVFAAGDEVATSSGSGAVSDITITSEVPVFSVTVPTALSAQVDETGVVSVASASSTKIVNDSYGPVYVSNIEAQAQGDWSIMAYDANYDISKAKPNKKEVGFKLNNVTSKNDGTLAGYDAADWAMTGVGNGAENYIEIGYDVKLPIQYTQLNSAVVVKVVFTVAWDTVNTN